jgi:hypothetical protein
MKNVKAKAIGRNLILIRENKIGCRACLAHEIAFTYLDGRDRVSEAALLWLLLRQEDVFLQLIAYRALSCCEQISETAAQKLEKYKGNKKNNGVIEQAKERFGILPNPIE